MTNERKRLLISIATALVLHLAVLILTGLNSFDYEIPKEFGPLTVELSPPVRAVAEKPAEKVPVEEIIDLQDESSPAPAPAEVVEEASVPEPESAPERSLPAAAPEPAASRPVPAAYSRLEPDDDFIAALKTRSGGTEGEDIRSLFGDDAIPAATDRLDVLEASGRASESEVVSSDVPEAREEDYDTAVRNNSDSEVTSVLAQDDLSSLDDRLSAGTGSSGTLQDSSAPALTSFDGTSSSSGNSPFIQFENEAAFRALTQWDHPEIPDEIGKEGARKYTVVIDFFVDGDGFTSGYSLRKPSGKAEIDAAVQSALRTWVFEEAASGSVSGKKKIPATLTYVIEIK
jgi:outer membrane biosynthesis protein TonB